MSKGTPGQRVRIKQRPSYRVGIEYIALNDEPLIMDAEEMTGYATVQLQAALFEVPPMQVAADVIKYRAKE